MSFCLNQCYSFLSVLVMPTCVYMQSTLFNAEDTWPGMASELRTKGHLRYLDMHSVASSSLLFYKMDSCEVKWDVDIVAVQQLKSPSSCAQCAFKSISINFPQIEWSHLDAYWTIERTYTSGIWYGQMWTTLNPKKVARLQGWRVQVHVSSRK